MRNPVESEPNISIAARTWNSFATRSLLVGAFVILLIGCRGDDATVITEDTTSNLTPTASSDSDSATSTMIAPMTTQVGPGQSTSTPTESDQTAVNPTSTPEPALPELPVFPADLAAVSSCRLAGDVRQVGSAGTAVAPTPTPLPAASDKAPSTITGELTDYQLQVQPIISSLSYLNEVFQVSWTRADSPDQQAAQLLVLGNRLSQMCSAMSELYIPHEALSVSIVLADSIRARHSWVSIALDEIQCCGTARTEFMNVGFDSTYEALKDSLAGVSGLIADVTDPTGGSPRTVKSEDRLSLTLSVTADGIIVRNGLDLLVIYVEEDELLLPQSLGQTPWRDGYGLKIKRIRNSSDLTVEDSIEEYSFLLALHGEYIKDADTDISGLDAVRIRYIGLESGWSGWVILFVRDGYTYFVELMCEEHNSEVCNSLQDTVSSIRVVA